MKTAIITVKTEALLKKRVEKFAKGTGMSLSDVVNFSLRYTVNLGKLVIKEPLTPNNKTANELDESLNNIKLGKNLSPAFGTAEEFSNYLDTL